MKSILSLFTVMLAVLFCFSVAEITVGPDCAEARSFKGGRSFKAKPAYKKTAPSSTNQMQNQRGGASRGMMGGLLGGALGGLLLGSLFGMGGQGMGILPLLLLAGGAWFLWRRFSKSGRSQRGQTPFGSNQGGQWNYPGQQGTPDTGSAGAPDIGSGLGTQNATTSETVSIEEGVAQIRQSDRDFDPEYFKEVASDVFFQVQAGWMRRDLTSYRHLLGKQLASEYDRHFSEMKEKGIINKLESIAIRGVDIVAAGSDGEEDFVTVRFTANLLDYTVSDTTGELVEGDMTTPVKFSEEWSWARPTGTEAWLLEGIA